MAFKRDPELDALTPLQRSILDLCERRGTQSVDQVVGQVAVLTPGRTGADTAPMLAFAIERAVGRLVEAGWLAQDAHGVRVARSSALV